MPVITAIIDQHAEESAFLWLLRNAATGEPHYDLADLAHLDDRVEANLDGLRIAGDTGWDVCKEAMANGEPGEIFTAGVLAFESLVPERMDAVLAVAVDSAALQGALCSALGWIDFERIASPARKLLSADLAFLKRIALSAHAVHRQDIGGQLAAFMADADPRVRSRALKAAGELGCLDLQPLVLEYINDDDEKSRFYAAWSAALLGETVGIDMLKAFVKDRSAYAQRATEVAVRKMNAVDALRWLGELAHQSELLRSVILGYGAMGDPKTIDWLIDMMSEPELARVAGQSLSMITGVDIAYQDLEGEWPEGFEAGPTENPEDEDVARDPDEDLPWPEPDLIRNWWAASRNRFRAGTRYLAGQPVSAEHCRNILASGFQRQRIAAALELALMKPGRPLFETRAPGFRQQRWIGIDK